MYVSEFLLSPVGSADKAVMKSGCSGAAIPTLGEREMSLSSREDITGLRERGRHVQYMTLTCIYYIPVGFQGKLSHRERTNDQYT